MFDYGTDFQTTQPELGPIGSIQWIDWERLNPGQGVFNWDRIDSKLALEANLKVTLLDGTEIPKPVVIQVMHHTSDIMSGYQYIDWTPGWIYDLIDQANPGDPRPTVAGRKVGYVLEGCDTVAAVPMYDNATWRKYQFDMVRALGTRYNDHPQVTAIVVNTGLDGETQPVKSIHCEWNTYLDEQVPGLRYSFTQFMQEVMQVYREAFPDKPIYINNAPGGSGTRKLTSDMAASFEPPIGLKHSGMWVDLDSHQGYGDFYGSWDMIRTYSMTLPIWLESPFGLGGPEHRYWSLIAGLHYHPDAIDCHPEYFTQAEPEWLRFTTAHLGVSLDDTPDVWTVLRDAEYPLVDWGKGGVSGHMGDWAFWLYRSQEAPQSDTAVVLREEMPAAKDHVFSRQARRTKQDENHIFMSFDIDDGYPYLDGKPIDLDGGKVFYRVHVTLLNRGTDTFSLQYRNWDGAIVRQVLKKGPELGPVDDWVTASFLVRDGYFNNNMPGDVDFRISCERDGDEYIHMVRVEGGWGIPPSPTETPRPTNTSPPTPTRAASATPPGYQTPRPPSEDPSLAPTPTPLTNAERFDPIADTTLDEWAPRDVTSSSPMLSARQGGVQAPLLRFDLSSIPQDALVHRAVLSLAVMKRSNAGYLHLAAHRVLRPWDERYCSWEQATERERWASPGCNDPDRDCAANFSADVWLDDVNRWFDLDLTTLVQDWVSSPDSNQGLILKASGRTNVRYDLCASEYSDPAARPRLWVAWEGSTGASPAGQGVAATSPAGTAPGLELAPAPLPQPTRILLREGDGYTRVSDTYIDAWAEEANYNRSLKLSARQGNVRVPLLRFDLLRIPVYASVKSATLHLYSTGRSHSVPLSLGVARLNRSWDPDSVTWLRPREGETWFLPGANDVGSDRAATLHALSMVDQERAWTHWEVTQLVQDWVSDPGRNHGLLLMAQGSGSVQYDFGASSWEPAAFRPYLEVEYLPMPPSPTPRAFSTPTEVPARRATPWSSWTPRPPAIRQVAKAVLQQGVAGYTGVSDTTLDAWRQMETMGSSSTLSVRQNGTQVALIQYDLGALPQHASVTRAQLSLWVTSSSNPGELLLRAYPLSRPWSEGGANWLETEAGVLWTGPGAEDDRATAPSGEDALSGSGKWITLDVTQAVQHWIQHPQENHGLLLRGEGQASVQHQFASSQWDQAGQRPKLIITYKMEPESGSSKTKMLTPLHWAGLILGPLALGYFLMNGSRIAQARQEKRRKVQ
ncbi:MAG: DNRLRE domain-containing protein [Anaerolineae bacterium]|nr:DNRLRE domain-containing protein [Anaerolineae bacterium]